jgi:hypothetical protein
VRDAYTERRDQRCAGDVPVRQAAAIGLSKALKLNLEYVARCKARERAAVTPEQFLEAKGP